jgi:hypothetical protein
MYLYWFATKPRFTVIPSEAKNPEVIARKQDGFFISLRFIQNDKRFSCMF